MSKETVFESLREEVNRLVSLKGQNNWSETRSNKNFSLVERKYSFGTRQCYERIDNDVYIDLQSSRSLAIYENDTLENVMSQIDEVMKLNSADRVRINELEDTWRSLEVNLGKVSYPLLNKI